MLLFVYKGFALKNTVCDFRQRNIIYQKRGISLKGRKLLEASTQADIY